MARKFRWSKNGGPWTETTQDLPYVLPGVTGADGVVVEPLGAAVADALDLPTFSVQPTFDQSSYVEGETVTLTEGVAGPSATLSLEYLTLDDVDVSGDLTGLDLDTTGYAAGTLAAQFRATNNAGSALSNEITVAVEASGSSPAVISSLSAGAQVDDAIPLTYTIDKTADCALVLLAGGAVAPSAAQVVAGTGGSDSAAAASGTVTLTLGGAPIDFDLTGLTTGTYDLYIVPEGSSVVSSTTGLSITVADAGGGGDAVSILSTATPINITTNNLAAYTGSHTAEGDCLVVCIGSFFPNGSLVDLTQTVVTYGGAAMTLANIAMLEDTAQPGSLIAYLKNPAAGAATLSIAYKQADGVTQANARSCAAFAYNLSGTAASPLGNTADYSAKSPETASTRFYATIIPATAGSLLIANGACGTLGRIATATADTTEVANFYTGTPTSNTDHLQIVGHKADAALQAYNLGATLDGSANLVAVSAVEFKAA